MVETSDFTNFILPSDDKMAVAVTDSLNLGTARGKTSLPALLSALTAAGVDVITNQPKAALTADGTDGVGAIAMSIVDTTARKSICTNLLFALNNRYRMQSYCAQSIIMCNETDLHHLQNFMIFTSHILSATPCVEDVW
jgi:hypothetical protein